MIPFERIPLMGSTEIFAALLVYVHRLTKHNIIVKKSNVVAALLMRRVNMKRLL